MQIPQDMYTFTLQYSRYSSSVRLNSVQRIAIRKLNSNTTESICSDTKVGNGNPNITGLQSGNAALRISRKRKGRDIIVYHFESITNTGLG